MRRMSLDFVENTMTLEYPNQRETDRVDLTAAKTPICALLSVGTDVSLLVLDFEREVVSCDGADLPCPGLSGKEAEITCLLGYEDVDLTNVWELARARARGAITRDEFLFSALLEGMVSGREPRVTRFLELIAKEEGRSASAENTGGQRTPQDGEK